MQGTGAHLLPQRHSRISLRRGAVGRTV